ncbi:hypothetical protein ACQ4PT_067290 [Festuca glaucescens]
MGLSCSGSNYYYTAELLTGQYNEYLEHILEYLTSFFRRTKPFQDVQHIFTKLESEFEVQWANGEASVLQESGIDLNQYNTAEELVELGMEKLKEALAAVGLKCGGTVQQRADRFFLLKHKQLQQLDSKHFAKVSRGSVSNVPSNGNTVKDGLKKQNALLEAKMSHLCEILDEVITRTKEKAEKTLPLNSEEMEVEREELPLGWDRKPVPYWLYKLRGPGQEAKALRERIQEDKG